MCPKTTIAAEWSTSGYVVRERRRIAPGLSSKYIFVIIDNLEQHIHLGPDKRVEDCLCCAKLANSAQRIQCVIVILQSGKNGTTTYHLLL